jgi:hypothetical protein
MMSDWLKPAAEGRAGNEQIRFAQGGHPLVSADRFEHFAGGGNQVVRLTAARP